MSAIDRQERKYAGGPERQAYEKPDLSVLALSVVTLGGSPGAGDSGAPNAENPFGNQTGTREGSPNDKSDDWGYDY
jgi:hypothetical protein